HEGNFFAVADANNFLDLAGGIGEQDRAREDTKISQAVALISVQLFARSNQSARADDFAQLVENLAFKNARARILRFRSARFGIALVHSAGVHGCLSETAGLLLPRREACPISAGRSNRAAPGTGTRTRTASR